MATDDVNEMIRRLSVRGEVTVSMALNNRVIKTEYDGHRTTTTYADIPDPEWTVHLSLRRRNYPEWAKTRIDAFVWDSFGFNSFRVTGADLATVLAEVLEKSEPPRADLADIIYAKAAP